MKSRFEIEQRGTGRQAKGKAKEIAGRASTIPI